MVKHISLSIDITDITKTGLVGAANEKVFVLLNDLSFFFIEIDIGTANGCRSHHRRFPASARVVSLVGQRISMKTSLLFIRDHLLPSKMLYSSPAISLALPVSSSEKLAASTWIPLSFSPSGTD